MSNEMCREISSSSTGLNKVAILFFFGFLAPFVTLSGLFSANRFNAGSLFVFMFIVFIAFLFIRSALSWKHVSINKNGLIISQMNFGKRKEIFVPFKNIKIVRQTLLQRFNPETVIIEFKHSTDFGHKIKFIPKIRFFPFPFFEHPIVKKLNALRKLRNPA